jgi:TPR repeat protein
METIIPVDYPAAHSMDSRWFAIDDAGEVALMDTGETGPAPIGPLCVDGLPDLLNVLDKDEYGIPIFPVVCDPFPEGWSTQALEDILASLPESAYGPLHRLAFQNDYSADDERKFRESILDRPLDCVVALADPADLLEFGKPRGLLIQQTTIIRLDPLQPIFHIIDTTYAGALCLLLKGRLLAWRKVEYDLDDDSYNYSGLDPYGIYAFQASWCSYRDYLREGFFPPAAPPEYERVITPPLPRAGLPAKAMTAQLDDKEDLFYGPAPLVHRLPGVRFAESKSIQVADLIPCCGYGMGELRPDSGESIIRRNLIALHESDAAERERKIAEWHENAEQGDLVAQYFVADLYSQGESPDYEQAYQWFCAAAEQAEAIASDSEDMFENGSAAQCCLADLYERGLGVAKNEARALFWYTKSAAKGNYLAKQRLNKRQK